eukprot:6137112-Pleurochrysis_carterae.AAC.1
MSAWLSSPAVPARPTARRRCQDSGVEYCMTPHRHLLANCAHVACTYISNPRACVDSPPLHRAYYVAWGASRKRSGRAACAHMWHDECGAHARALTHCVWPSSFAAGSCGATRLRVKTRQGMPVPNQSHATRQKTPEIRQSRSGVGDESQQIRGRLSELQRQRQPHRTEAYADPHSHDRMDVLRCTKPSSAWQAAA